MEKNILQENTWRKKCPALKKKNVSHVAPLYVVICLGKTQNQIIHTRPSSPATLLKRQ